jgi:hypothetical protein
MTETVKVRVETESGAVELEFKDLQQAMERVGEANLETLRRWVRSLEAGCDAVTDETQNQDLTTEARRPGEKTRIGKLD